MGRLSRFRPRFPKTEDICVWRRKPLYGSRYDPLRWYIAVAGLFRKAGYRFRRADLCIFSRIIDGIIFAIVILRVGDFLISATPAEHEHFRPTTESMKSGPMVSLAVGPSFVFRGLNLGMTKAGSCAISKDDYRSRIIPIGKCCAVDVPLRPLKMAALPRVCRAFAG